MPAIYKIIGILVPPVAENTNGVNDLFSVSNVRSLDSVSFMLYVAFRELQIVVASAI